MRRLITTGVSAGLTLGLVAGLAAMAMPSAAQEEPVTVETDVVYRTVDGEALGADVYLPAEEGRARPAVLIIHGGGWVSGEKAWFADQANQLAAAGYVAVSVDYRLAPAHPYPAPVEDVEAAVKWLRKPKQVDAYGIDPDRIGVLGGSAGAHLAGMLGVLGHGSLEKGARVAAVVEWSGPMDLTRVAAAFDAGTSQPDGSVAPFLGCTAGDCPAERAAQASPVTHVDKTDSPMLLINSDAELVPLALVQPMVDALEDAGVEHELLVLPGNRHSRAYSADVMDDTIAFFDDHLAKPADRG